MIYLLSVLLFLVTVLDVFINRFTPYHMILLATCVAFALVQFLYTKLLLRLPLGRTKSILRFSKVLILVLLIATSLHFSSRVVPQEDATVKAKIAENYIREKNLGKAEEVLGQAIAKYPKERALLIAQAKLNFARKNYNEAISQFSETAKDPMDKESTLYLAKSFYLNNNVNVARSTCEKLLHFHPDYAPGYELMGDTFWDSGDALRGMYYYNLAEKSDPSYVPGQIKLGNALQKTHSYGDALIHLQKAESLASSEEDKNAIRVALADLRKEIDQNASAKRGS